MIIRYFRLALSLAVCVTAIAAQPTFRIVTYMNNQYGPPLGIAEGAPGVFYFPSGSAVQAAFSVTKDGSRVALGRVTGYFKAPLFSGANGRFYSAAQAQISSGHVVSFDQAPDSKRSYPAQNLVPILTENLPDATFLSIAGSGTTGLEYVAKVSAEGAITTIFQFPTTENAGFAVLYATDGNYYGTYGVYADSSAVVYRLTPSGVMSTLLSLPAGNGLGPLIQASDGNLYGGGTINNYEYGIVYRLTLGGQYTILYTFPKGPGGIPDSLIEGGDGNLYGTTIGAGGNSQLFSVSKTGQYTLLHRMVDLTADGGCPCHLIQGSDGIFYGNAVSGGINGGGAIFALNTGLPTPPPRPLQFVPASGAVGRQVLIWGTNLLSAAVAFNGVAATEVSNSGPNYIKATVPTGATTGPITITTPGGAVTTQASFTVE